MLRNVIILLFLFSPTALVAQSVSESIEFEERVFSFGTIEEVKGKVSHTFVFRNKGKKPVEISSINSACGCIGKVVSPGAIAPGAKGEVTITFNPAYNEGFFSKEIVVLSNNGTEYNRIWVEGKIIAGERPVADEYPYAFGNNLHLRLKVMALGYLKPGETKEMDLHYANDSNEEMNLSFRVHDGIGGQVLFTNPGKIAPKARGVVKVKYRMPLYSMQDEQVKLIPMVNGKPGNDTVIVRALNDQKPMQLPLRRS